MQLSLLSYEDITCWTCANKTDNEACNNWAPEIRCPIGHSVCKSVHRFDRITMEIISVTKTCSLPERCSGSDVGCRPVDVTVSECISCCTESYCNEEIPHDHASAFRLSMTSLRSAGFRARIASQLIFMIYIVYFNCVSQ